MKTKNVKVKIECEYEIFTDHLDSKYVDINGFVKDEAIRMLKDDINNDMIDVKIIEKELGK